MPWQSALGGGRLRRGTDGVRQARQLVLATQLQAVGVLIGEHVLTELGGQGCEAFHQRSVALLCDGGQACASTNEVALGLLQQPQLFGRQGQRGALGVQRVDAREQRCMHVDGAGVCRQRLGHLSLHLLQGGRRLGGTQIVERALKPRQQATRRIESGQRVVESWRLNLRADGIELLSVLAHRRAQRGRKVLRAQAGKGRQLVGRIPGLEQRVGGCHGRVLQPAHLPALMAFSSSSR